MQKFRKFYLLTAMLCSLCATLTVSVTQAQEQKEQKLAIVIGIGDYENTTRLPNAVADAKEFDKFLREQGFESVLLTDGDRKSVSDALSGFVRKIGPSDTALFYFSGHGMQFRGENQLLTKEAKLQSEFDISGETLSLAEIITAIERRARITLVFIDACRNNPLSERLVTEVDGASRSAATRGLAPMKTNGAGTMVAFAAEPGQVAYDGMGSNSPFTRALIDNLSRPGLEVGTAFKRVIRQVRSETQDRQSPQLLSSLALEFYFGPTDDLGPISNDFLADIDFAKAERISTVRIWNQFLNKYPGSDKVPLAREAISLLRGDSSVRLSPSEIEARLKLTKAQKREIQLALRELGYDVPATDGSFGTGTRKQLARYQKAIGVPETGFVSELLAARLNIAMIATGDEVFSADEAREYDVSDLKGLEPDERVLKTIGCLQGYETMYGSFGGHLYVAVNARRQISWSTANTIATNCGGYLTSVTSSAENDFVAAMVNKDDCLFYVDYGGGWTTKKGPWIGLVQDAGGREPKGGWKWTNGEKIGFSAWYEGSPNNFNDNDDVGIYATHEKGRGDMKDVYVKTWDDMIDTDQTFSFVMEKE
ncbi:caspase family protein [Rhizobium leguminosarum]|uniref:caspase family protein n=1 Tax=Rhizobium leguminosarum TaxID=384 RepID=UPI0014427FB5|nr:caspase family protein [Rhizobium leguminosarum]MBY5867688.1 CHAT domain-containing protein [Rhizobium leguminosarum]